MYNYRHIILYLTLLAITPACLCAPGWTDSRPTLLVFEAEKGEGSDKEIALSATRALRTYFRETKKVDASIFDRESPTVKRAVLDKKMTEDNVAGYASQTERVKVAQLLGFDYAAGAEVAIRENNVTLKIWLAKAGQGKAAKWEATGSALSAGAGDSDIENALQSAASASVIDISRRAFSELQTVAERAPATPDDTTAITPPSPVQQPVSSIDYAARADENVASGNLALAIQQYSQAVSSDPGNFAVRMKLAETYARKGMFAEADDEIGRAVMMGADRTMVDEMRRRIDLIRGGEKVSGTPKVQAPMLPDRQTAPVEQDSGAGTPTDALRKLADGDRHWRDGRPDEAAESYKASIKINPTDWRALERLAIVNATMSLFNESRKALVRLNELQPNPSVATLDNRYEMFRRAFDYHFTALVRQYDSDATEFSKKKLSRESYYQSTNGLALRLESMAKLLDELSIPSSRTKANIHRSLAFGLMAQAASSVLDYLETNNGKSKSNAEVFALKARKEIETVARLEASTVIIRREEPAADEQAQTDESPEVYPQDPQNR